MSALDWNAVDEQMRPRVRSVARCVLRDEHEAEDAVQDTFLRAVEGIDRLRERESLRAWLLTIAWRAALDRRRQFGRCLQVSDVEDVPDQRVLEPADAMELAEAFSRLEPKHRHVLDLVARGWSTERIALSKGVTVEAVKTRIFRARARLRQLVSP